MDPLYYTLLTGALGSIIASITEKKAADVVAAFETRLQKGGQPVNHDLQRAVREAYLKATLFVCKSFMEECGVSRKLLKDDKPADRPPSIAPIEAVRQKLYAEIELLSAPDYVPSAEVPKAKLKLLLHSENMNAKEQIEALKAELKEQVILQICEWQSGLPERFIQRFRKGWQRNGVQLDWFNSLCLWFAEILKNDERVRTIFQSGLLAELGVSIEVAQKKLEEIGNSVREIFEHLFDIKEKIEGIATDVHTVLEQNTELNRKLEELQKLLESKLSDDDLKKAYKSSFPEDFWSLVPHVTVSSVIELIRSEIPLQNGTDPLLVFARYLFCEMIRDEQVKAKLQNWIRRVDPKLDIESVCAGANSRKSQKSVQSLIVKLIPDPNNRSNEEQEFDVEIYEWRESENSRLIYTGRCKKENILEKLDELVDRYEDEDIQIEFFLPCDLISLDVDGWKKKEDFGFESRLAQYYQIIVKADRHWLYPNRKKIPAKFRKKWKENWKRFQNYSTGTFNDECVLCECDHQSYDPQKLSGKFITSKHICLMMTFLPPKPADFGFAILSAGIPVALWCRESVCEVESHQRKKDEIMQVVKDGMLKEIPERVHKVRQKASLENDLGNHLTLLWDDPNRVPDKFKEPQFDDSNI